MDHTVLVQNQAEIFEHYNSAFVAAGYGRQEYITPCEQLLFSTYIRPGMAILDIGVGGGRTSPCLAKSAARYVGIRFCAGNDPPYPAESIHNGRFRDRKARQSISAGFKKDRLMRVMSYNSLLDDLIPSESRWQCLQECHRVLRNSGVLIFSSHNPLPVIAKTRRTTPGEICPHNPPKPLTLG